MLLLGAWIFWRHSIVWIPLSPETSRIVSTSLWIASGSLLALTLWPPALRPLYLVMSVVGWPIGMAVSVIIMFVIYFLLITPLSLIFRLIGRDALHRKPDPGAETYWIPVSDRPDAARYFRQF